MGRRGAVTGLPQHGKIAWRAELTREEAADEIAKEAAEEAANEAADDASASHNSLRVSFPRNSLGMIGFRSSIFCPISLQDSLATFRRPRRPPFRF